MTSKTLAGRPINGYISRYTIGPMPQKPITQLVTALNAVFKFPEVEAIRWSQNTPYGPTPDESQFIVHRPRVQFRGDCAYPARDLDGFAYWRGEYPAGYMRTHAYPSLIRRDPEKYAGHKPVSVDDVTFTIDGVDRKDIHQAVGKFADRLVSGSFNVKLNELFGDPSTITATREEFAVETYEHD
ncbi:hypothetical protein PXH69_24430 [Rhodococcus qingshengii]|uniref:Uncharacterized protein n=1 Tax=Rhodococcus qingshengii TaxID=334542 RepID=A0AAW6LQQ1_RHOSG|nr:hypothetical protein [Rhodococcus qingshengii]MDE8648118.1 hypothetical protein [Rhodococcus qingshengii]